MTSPSLSPLSKEKKLSACTRGGKKWRKNRTTHDATKRALLELSFRQMTKKLWGRGAHMSASRATRQRSPPLSRACKLCVRRIVKIPRAHTAIRGIFSVNFHTEGGPPPPPLSSRRPDRSIKFQRWNGNTWTYFTLLKSLPYSAEKPKAGKTAFPCSRLIETLSSNFRKLLRFVVELDSFLFFWERDLNERGGYFFELVFLTWRNFKHLPRGLYI